MRIRYSAGCVFVVALIAAIGGAADSKATQPATERLNVLFIAVDDLRPELGTYGAPVVTPNIDRLAAAGLRFDRAYTQAAACAASRAAMLTGTYPHTSGVYLMRPSLGQANPDLATMPQLFKDAGYETIEIGKFAHKRGDTPGAWSRKRWMPEWHPPEYYEPQNRRHTGRRKRPRGPVTEGAEVSDDTYLDGKLAAHAVEELRRLKDRTFFLAVGFVRPHLPFNCPRRYWDLYDRWNNAVPDTISADRVPKQQWHNNYEPALYAGGRPIDQVVGRQLLHGYRACVSYIDAQVGLLLDELDRLGLSERTLVLLWGDNGWHLGEHGLWGKNTALDVALRIPLIVRLPGFTDGESTAALVETVDILPTLCELTGIPVPDQVEGTSFVPLLEDPKGPGKPAVFGWCQRVRFSGQTVRTARYRLVRWVPKGNPQRPLDVELYDHENDPNEYVNLARLPERAETVQQLNGLLDAWLRHDPVAPAEPDTASGTAASDDSRWPPPTAKGTLAVIAFAIAGIVLLRRSIARTRYRSHDP
jgi:iduronate 2-sulfatase